MAANPMSQFDVYRIGPEIKVGAFDISFTNASLFMILSSVSILLIFNLGSKKNLILPNKIQLLPELSYTFVYKMLNFEIEIQHFVQKMLEDNNTKVTMFPEKHIVKWDNNDFLQQTKLEYAYEKYTKNNYIKKQKFNTDVRIVHYAGA